ISLFLTQLIGRHHVIFSYNEKSHYLIKDLRQGQERVIVVDEKIPPESQSILDSWKVMTLKEETPSDVIFKKCSLHKAKSITLFHEKDRDSLYVLMKLEEYIKSKPKSWSLNKVLVHIEDARYKKELKAFLEHVE